MLNIFESHFLYGVGAEIRFLLPNMHKKSILPFSLSSFLSSPLILIPFLSTPLIEVHNIIFLLMVFIETAEELKTVIRDGIYQMQSCAMNLVEETHCIVVFNYMIFPEGRYLEENDEFEYLDDLKKKKEKKEEEEESRRKKEEENKTAKGGKRRGTRRGGGGGGARKGEEGEEEDHMNVDEKEEKEPIPFFHPHAYIRTFSTHLSFSFSLSFPSPSPFYSFPFPSLSPSPSPSSWGFPPCLQIAFGRSF